MRLSELKSNQKAKIVRVHHLTAGNTEQSGTEQGSTQQANTQQDSIAVRLVSLGFVAGEPIEIITRSIFGGDPILVKLGFARFALRRNEAERIEISI